MENQIQINLQQGLRVKYIGSHERVFIECYNPFTGFKYSKNVKRDEEFFTNIQYPAPWIIRVFHKNKVIVETQLSFKGSHVAIQFATTAMGDTLAWVPIVQRWIEQNEPEKVYLVTAWNHLFDKTKYSDKLVWVDSMEELQKLNPFITVGYVLGIPREHELSNDIEKNHANPVSWKDSNMIDTINFSFGLEPIHVKPHLIELPKERLVQEKYITVCFEASQKLKHLLTPMELVKFLEYIKSVGLKPIVLGLKPSIYPWVDNVITHDIKQAMQLIRDAEFHIGYSSGLSWMANAYDKHVLMITNFTHPGYEFNDRLTRVVDPKSEQIGVFNNTQIPWEPVYDWDPYKDGMQLCKTITSDMMIGGLQHLIWKMENNVNVGTVLGQGQFYPIQKIIPKTLPKLYTLSKGNSK